MTASTGKFKQMRGFDRGVSADLFRRKQAEIAQRASQNASSKIAVRSDVPAGPAQAAAGAGDPG